MFDVYLSIGLVLRTIMYILDSGCFGEKRLKISVVCGGNYYPYVRIN